MATLLRIAWRNLLARLAAQRGGVLGDHGRPRRVSAPHRLESRLARADRADRRRDAARAARRARARATRRTPTSRARSATAAARWSRRSSASPARTPRRASWATAWSQSARQSARVALVGVDPEREARVSVVGRARSSREASRRRQRAGRAQPARARARRGARRARSTSSWARSSCCTRPGEAGLGAFRVAGIFRTGSPGFDKTTVFLRLEDAQRLLELGDRVHEVAFALDDPRTAAGVPRVRARRAAAAPARRVDSRS